MRYALGIEYDGSGFFGWQTQREEPTVQATLEEALSRVANQPVRVICAGRTDTGVHAWCQVVHFDTEASRPEHSWILGANSNLPESVSVVWAREVAGDFHARFSALGRRYRYVILNRWVRPSIEHGTVSWNRWPLDEQLMHEASQALLGEHDFSSFRSSGCKANHPIREIQSISVTRQDERVMIDIAANGFLYHMVRNIAGTLMEIGEGKQAVLWMAELLELRDRTKATTMAPPDGLYFVGVRYPQQYELPVEPPVFLARQDL